MVTTTNDVIINFKAQLDASIGAANKFLKQSLGETNERMETLKKASESTKIPLNQVESSFNKIGKTVLNTGEVMNLTTGDIDNMKDSMKSLSRTNGRFRGELLSAMFIVMGLQRVLTSFTRSAITSFQKANEDTEGLGKATWHLQAAWEFFKYSLVDALTQSPLFKVIVELLVQFVSWLNRLSPGQKALIAIALVLLLISLPLALIIIQFGILAATLNTSIAGAFLFVAGIILGVILIIVGIGLVIWATVGIINNWGKDWGETIKFIGILLIGLSLIILGVAIIIGSWPLAIAAAVILIIAGVALLVSWIIKNWDKVTEYWYKMTAALEKGWIIFIAALKIAFLTAIQFWLDKITFFVRKVLELLSKIPGIGNLAKTVLSGFDKINDVIDAQKEVVRQNKQVALDAVDAELNARLKAIEIERQAKEAATLEAKAEQEKNSTLSNMTGGVKDKILGEFGGGMPSLDMLNGANGTKQIIQNDNSNNTYNIQIPESLEDKDDIARYVIEQINNSYSQSNDSTS
jgi:hypothetical protein